jgi:hypothetical protein
MPLQHDFQTEQYQPRLRILETFRATYSNFSDDIRAENKFWAINSAFQMIWHANATEIEGLIGLAEKLARSALDSLRILFSNS